MPKVTQYVDKQLFVCDILNNFWHIPLFKQIIMKYKLFSLFFMLLLPISGHAQNATILFSTEQDCEISIYEPIDGGYNNQLPTTILKVTTNKPCIYSTDIVSFNFIYCQFSQGTKCEVILFPNDSLKIHINNKQITFEGSNQDGLEYLQDKFTNASHYDLYMGPMEELINEYVGQKREFNTIIPEIQKNIILPTMKTINEIPLSTTTSQDFIDKLGKEILLQYNSYLILLLRSILEIEDYKVTAIKDSTEIVNQIDNLFKTTALLSRETLKYDYDLFVSQYLVFYYGEEAPEECEENIFGPYRNILYAPIDMHPVLLGKAYLRQLERNTPVMNLPKVRKYFNEKFPDSQYTAIINDKSRNEEDSKDFFCSYIKQNIDSLSQLRTISELKNKYIFIDLWASWCMPCRHEFKYKKELNELLSTYKDISVVYISIDSSTQKDSWQQCINNYKLSGFHLLAASELQKSIQKQIYGSDEFTIPRYILLNSEGKILHKNLPRPSHISELKEVLDKIMQ